MPGHPGKRGALGSLVGTCRILAGPPVAGARFANRALRVSLP
ncbi:hypothetical protein PJP10_17490 [Mycobacterium kansasii]